MLTERVDYSYNDNDWLLAETLNGGGDTNLANDIVTQYSYNANGSQISKTRRHADTLAVIDQVLNDWDQQGRLAAVSFDDDADGAVDRRVDYKSDDGGLRVSRTEAGVETKLLWDHTLPYGQVVAEYVAGDEDATVRYTFGQQVISQERVPYANGEPTSYFYHQDGHSGVRQMAQGFAGQLLIFDNYSYDAFGVLLNPEASASTPNTRQYRGEMRDPTTGLIDLRARPTYDPGHGRPVRVPDGRRRSGA